MHAQRKDAVKGLTGGIEFLFKKNKIEWLKGHASFESADTVKVGDRTVRAKNIVIATGSSVTPLPGVEIDEKGRRLIDRRAGAGQGPGSPGRHWRRRDRAGAWQRVAAGRREGDLRRIPRPDPTRFRRRRPQGNEQDLQEAGDRIQARHQGDRREDERRQGHAHRRAGKGRRGRDNRGRRRAGVDRPAPEHRWPGARQSWPPDQPARADRDRPRVPYRGAGRLGDRRCDSRARCSPTRPRTRELRSPRISLA